MSFAVESNNNLKILNYIRHLFLKKSVKKSIELLLHPCCDLTIVDADITCDESNDYTVVVTLGSGIVFPGASEANLIVNDTVVSTVDNPSGKTLTFTAASFASGSVQLTVEYKLYTNTAQTIGVFLKSNTFASTAPAC